MPEDDQPGHDQPGHDQKGFAIRTLVGLALIVVLILGMLFVVQQLRHATAIQDCVASGRTNCAPITSGQ